MTLEFRKGIGEVLDILEHLEEEYRNKVPQKFKEFLEDNKLETYYSKLDHSKKIEEMSLSRAAKKILGVIYWKYWCDKAQKAKFIKKVKLNEIIYYENMKKIYNPDEIFKKIVIGS